MRSVNGGETSALTQTQDSQMCTAVRVCVHGTGCLRDRRSRGPRAIGRGGRRSQPSAEARSAGAGRSVSAERLSVLEVARRAGLSRPAVWRWQRRFAEEGVDGLLRDKTRPPGKPPLPAAIVAGCWRSPAPSRRARSPTWTGRAMAKAVGISCAPSSASGRPTACSRTAFAASSAPTIPPSPQGHRHRRSLHASPGSRRGAVDRREVADPSARPHPARSAAQARQVRNHDARLQAQRYHHPVRRLNVVEGTVLGRCMQSTPIGSSSASSMRSSEPCRPARRSTPSPTITHPQASQGACLGWPGTRAGCSTSRDLGLRINAVENFFSALTRRRLKRGVFRSILDLQAAINRYIASTTMTPSPSSGPNLPKASSPKSTACMYLRMSRCTR